MAYCSLCESYMTDTLDCFPNEFPNRRNEFIKGIRAGLPLMVRTFQSILTEIGIELTEHFYQMELNDIFTVCLRYPLFLELLEDTLSEMGRRHGILSKFIRNWLLNKYLLILGTIYKVHLEHTMIPMQHKQKKEIGKEIPVISPVSSTGLTIRIPTYAETDIYS